MSMSQQQRRWIWQMFLVVGLLAELVLISGAVDAMLTEGDKEIPAWQQIAFVGILVWIYIAYLKQRALDLSTHMVDAKIKTHTLIEQLPEAIILVDADNRVLILNRRAAELSGLNDAEALGLDIAGELGEPAAGRLRGGSDGETDGRFARSRKAVRLSIRRLGRAAEAEAHKLVVVRDAAPTPKAAGPAPGRGVERAAELLRLAGDRLAPAVRPDSPQPLRADAARAALRILAARELLDGGAADLAALRKDRVNVKPLLDETVRALAGAAEALHVAWDMTGVADIAAQADGPRLALALRLVLLNAVAGAEDAGGTVRVKTGALGQNLGLAVTDPGPAPDAAAIPTLFADDYAGVKAADGRPGRTGSPGLQLARRIVEAHGGSLWAQPAEGGGLTVTLMVPGA